LVRWLRPVRADVKKRIQTLTEAARAYGLALYVGRVMAIGTYNMDILMVAAFTDARSVSYYALAGAIAAPVGLPATALASALFPTFGRSPPLGRAGAAWASLVALLATLVVHICAYRRTAAFS